MAQIIPLAVSLASVDEFGYRRTVLHIDKRRGWILRELKGKLCKVLRKEMGVGN